MNERTTKSLVRVLLAVNLLVILIAILLSAKNLFFPGALPPFHPSTPHLSDWPAHAATLPRA